MIRDEYLRAEAKAELRKVSEYLAELSANIGSYPRPGNPAEQLEAVRNLLIHRAAKISNFLDEYRYGG